MAKTHRLSTIFHAKIKTHRSKTATAQARYSQAATEGKKRALTSLRDDGSGGNDDNGPVELALEVGDYLVADLVEGSDGSVRNLDEEHLAS